VELDQIDVVDAQPLQRAFQARPRGVPRAVARLGGDEELVRMRGQPGCEPQLGVAVRRGDVEVVHAGVAKDREQLVGPLLPHGAQCRGAEDDPAALVPGAPEGGALDHVPRLRAGGRVVARIRRSHERISRSPPGDST
jgi:hypothetical protein